MAEQAVREQRLKMGNLFAILGFVFLVPAMVGGITKIPPT